MLSGQMVFTLLLLLALSVAAHEAPLFLLCLALLVAALISRLWERYALARVEYRRSFGSSRVEFGDEVELAIEVVNRKPLPLSWLEVEDEIPASLQVLRGRVQPSYRADRCVLASLMAMRPYERVRRHYLLRCPARGEHLFGPAKLHSGDLFGFALCDRTVESRDSLVVYPRVVPLERLGLPANNPLGDIRAQSWIFDDPSRVAGAREYRPGDSMRRVHWPATARSGRLQTRLYEATTAHKLGVFLNVSAGEGPAWTYGFDPDVLEFSIVVAASVVAWGLDRGYQVGLYSNGLHRGAGGVSIDPASSPRQMEAVLLALARLEPIAGERFEDLLDRESRRLPFGMTAIVVSPGLSEGDIGALRQLRGVGHGLVAVLTGRGVAAASVPGVLVRRAGPPDGWRSMPAVRVGAG
ncbi:MAG TPA: DUF58 domain-containing protein [Chloroflexota bacterium]